MEPIKHLAYVIVIFATFYLGFLHPVEAADKTCDPWAAKAVSVQGIVETRKAGQTHWVQVILNDTFCTGDMIRVQENSRAAVVLGNETNLSLDQKTTITFTEIEQKKSFLLDLLAGALHFFSRFPRSIKVLTPFLNASVEGTEGFIRVTEEEVFLSIFEGKVLASNAAGSHAQRRPIGRRRERQSTGAAGCGASQGRGPLGLVLSAGHICSARRSPQRRYE